MTRRVLILVAVAVAVAAPSASVAAGDSTPALRAVKGSPLVVKGTGFKPMERVTLSARLMTGDRVVRRTIASRAGAFTVRFEITPGGCSGVRSVGAVGAKGSLAILRTPIITRDCPPPPAD